MIYTQCLVRLAHTLSKVHRANPPNALGPFNITEAVIDEETFGGILHPCLAHSLTRAESLDRYECGEPGDGPYGRMQARAYRSNLHFSPRNHKIRCLQFDRVTPESV